MTGVEVAKAIFLKQPRFPIYATYFVTSKCQARCRHCFYRAQLDSRKAEMSIDEIERVAKSMGKLAHLNLTGGEPFIRSELAEIASLFRQHCGVASMGFATNGFDPSAILGVLENLLTRWSDLNLRINVSIDHYDERHDELRQCPGLLRRAIETIAFLKRLDRNRVVVGVNLLLSQENVGEIDRIYRFIRDDVQPDRINPLYPRTFLGELGTAGEVREAYAALIDTWSADLRRGKFTSHPTRLLASILSARDVLVRKRIVAEANGAAPYLPCWAGRLGMVIEPDGEILPCELIRESMGNVRDFDYNFHRLWMSSAAHAIRQRIWKDRCSCTHECFQSLNVVLNAKAYPALLAEWLR